MAEIGEITINVDASAFRDYAVQMERELDRIIHALRMLKWDIQNATEYNRATVRVVTAR